MQGQPDAHDQRRALELRAAIARGASIHQHGRGVISVTVEGEGSMLITSGDELRTIIPGWPRPDEAAIPGRAR